MKSRRPRHPVLRDAWDKGAQDALDGAPPPRPRPPDHNGGPKVVSIDQARLRAYEAGFRRIRRQMDFIRRAPSPEPGGRTS